MALALWKTLDFFEVSQIRPPDEETASFLDSNEISCVCSGSDSLFLGSYDGMVRILSSTFKIQRSFKAYDIGSLTHMKQIEGTALLVTIAEDLSNEPVLKVWALDKPVKKTGLPTCQSMLSIQNGRKPFPISAFTAVDDLSQVAVGFANGAVSIIRGDLIHDRGTKQRIVFESEEPITGVEFQDVTKNTTLFVATTNRILKLVISGKGQGQPARAIEDSGCGVGCMTMDKQNGDIVVVRDDAIYYYGLDGRGPCFAYDGPKSLVEIYKDYVALVSPPVSSDISKSSTLRKFGGVRANELFRTSTFTLLDTDLKVVAHSESLVSQVKAIYKIWGDLFTLTMDGKINRYHEKSLQQKLDIFYQRNLYVYAINLAQRSGMDPRQQTIIFRKHGDYLYQKGDYDSAMQQYLKAVDSTEPSQVIRKFLDTQRIHNLIEYLEELHEHHKAMSDHTTLLLNCYAKLKDIEKLEKFIKSPGDLKFDLDTAISMCRQGTYYEQAAYLATKHGEHELVIDIMIEDLKKHGEALDYISRLEPEAAYPILMKYARVLLENCPRDTTEIFIEYYTGRYQPKQHAATTQYQAPETGFTTNAVQNLTSLLPLPYMGTAGGARSPSTNENIKTVISEGQTAQEVAGLSVTNYSPPRPRSAFSSFVDHPDEFIVFLEACLKADGLNVNDKVDLYTALFEMYLYKANERNGEDRGAWEDKAKKLIEGRDAPIDTSNVLLLSHLSGFRDGTTLVREQAGLRFDIFRSYTSAKDTRGAIKALRKYGPDEPQLYPAALAYFTSDPRVLEEAGEELNVVLRKISDDGLMAPLQVIQTLSTNAVATMGMIRHYLQETIERERKDISNNRRLIESYRTETETKRKEIDEITTKSVVFNAKRCQSCAKPLELPVVHFLCKHSYHKQCLNANPGGEAKMECSQCAQNNSTIRAIRKAQDESADRQDIFQEALQRSQDKFGTIAEFFGRGVMSTPKLD